MAKGKYTVVEKNKPIASQLKAYEKKERGYSLIEKELKRRFVGLDWRYQKRIIVDFIQGCRSAREWVLPKLLDIWDESFEPLVKEAWEKYHDERCSWVVIRQMPEDYVLSQLDELAAIDGNYRFICRRLAGNSRFEVDVNRLEPLVFLELLKNGYGFEEMGSDELLNVFLRATYNLTSHITSRDLYEFGYHEFCVQKAISGMSFDMNRFMYLLPGIDVSDRRNAELCEKIDEWYGNVYRASMSDIAMDFQNINDYKPEVKSLVEQSMIVKHIRMAIQKQFGFNRDANDDWICRYLHDINVQGKAYKEYPGGEWYEIGDYESANLDEFAEINPAVKDMLGEFDIEGNGDGEDEVVPF